MFSGPVGPVAVFFTSLKLFFEMYTGLGSAVRPLQFNYLSYELFLEKKSCQTPKKKENKIDASGVKRLIPCMSFCS